MQLAIPGDVTYQESIEITIRRKGGTYKPRMVHAYSDAIVLAERCFSEHNLR